DRAPAPGDLALQDQIAGRSRVAERIETVVPVEALVLDGDEGLGHVTRQVLEGDRRAALLAELGDQAAIVRQDLGRTSRLPGVDLRDRGAVVADVPPAADGDTGAEGRECQEGDEPREEQAAAKNDEGKRRFGHRDSGKPGSGTRTLLHPQIGRGFPRGEGLTSRGATKAARRRGAKSALRGSATRPRVVAGSG